MYADHDDDDDDDVFKSYIEPQAWPMPEGTEAVEERAGPNHEIMQTIASIHHPYICRVEIKLQTLRLAHIQCHQILFYQINMYHTYHSTYTYILEFSNNEQHISKLFPFFGVIPKNEIKDIIGASPPPMEMEQKDFLERK